MSLPSSRFARLQFMESHETPFADHQAAIGLSVETAAAFAADTASARAAWDSYVAARQAYDAARISWYDAIADGTDTARSALRSINTFAKDQANPGSVYALAEIDPPKPREPLGKPDTPTDLEIFLDVEGQANVRWAGSRVGGTVFTVQRRTASTGGQLSPWTTLATVPERVFVDLGTPSGVASVQYRVRGERVGGQSLFSSPIVLFLGASGNQQQVAGAIAPVEASGKQAG